MYGKISFLAFLKVVTGNVSCPRTKESYITYEPQHEKNQRFAYAKT